MNYHTSTSVLGGGCSCCAGHRVPVRLFRRRSRATLRDPARPEMAACPCVLVLCGAPAAGKSSLSRELRRRPARRVDAVHHISFDSIERDTTVRGTRGPTIERALALSRSGAF